uniref:Uncharacterized protein n=1 Tax=Magallana gigas TaxID=29159 RepID=K1Q1H3_MAGGI
MSLKKISTRILLMLSQIWGITKMERRAASKSLIVCSVLVSGSVILTALVFLTKPSLADYAEIRSPALVFKELADRATASADPYLRIITPAHGFTELVVSQQEWNYYVSFGNSV